MFDRVLDTPLTYAIYIICIMYTYISIHICIRILVLVLLAVLSEHKVSLYSFDINFFLCWSACSIYARQYI